MHDRITRRTVLRGAMLGGFATMAQRLAGEPEVDSRFTMSALIDGSGLVRIPSGEFQMGSDEGNPDERPRHRIVITHEFEMSKYEVTQAQWDGVLAEAHPRPDMPLRNKEGVEVSRNPSHFKGLTLPVESVSWDDIQLFLTKLNARDADHLYRLPTEAEWEYACVGGANPGGKLWNVENSGEQTHRVGQLEPNTFGLYDLDGNVSEWVQDWYGRIYYSESPAKNPGGPESGSYRVYRGGSWLEPPKRCRPSFRGFEFPANRLYNVGFRVVRMKREAA